MNNDRHHFDTSRSRAQVAAFRTRDFVAERRVIRFSRTVPAPPQEIFPQLCPTRECDWIDGWRSELVYTDSGYGEDRCVFRTDENNITGPGLWTFSHVEAPRLLKIVRVAPPFLQHLSIALEARPDGATDTHWTVTVTALAPEGNRALQGMPADDEAFAGSAEALAHFFREGKMKPKENGGGGGHGRGHEHGHGHEHGNSRAGQLHGLLSGASRWLREQGGE